MYVAASSAKMEVSKTKSKNPIREGWLHLSGG